MTTPAPRRSSVASAYALLAYALVAHALLATAPASAQAAPSRTAPPPVRAVDADPALRPTVERLREALAALAASDRELMPSEGVSSLRGADDAALDRRARARVRVMAGLDTLLASGASGRAAIQQLASEWPGIDPLRRAEVRAAIGMRDATDALRLVDRLQETAPRDTQLLRWRADALDSLSRAAESLRVRQARFELAPEEEEGWRALLQAHATAGTLPRLRESLARLRVLYPDSRAVREHEIEVLHRLGRLDEAARLSADSTWRRP
ncbi:MAG: hypothetical protein KJZ74_14440 [Gemmatimonadales bacterium]|nr:hypothetical protein [Gemmatimonadales bacterium]